MNRRLDLGLFQRDVAREIEVDTETVYRWESNESTPQIQFFPAIAAGTPPEASFLPSDVWSKSKSIGNESWRGGESSWTI